MNKMTDKTLCCYFPTTVVFIDDDEIFLQSISVERDMKGLPYRYFLNPNEALSYLNRDTYLQRFKERMIRHVQEYEYGEESLGLYFIEIIKEVFNRERYSQVSVVVVDYEMPAMRGLELCQRIENPFVKKILLTGAADESIAINAFNQGLIDQYICKQDPVYDYKLYQVIEQAQHDYFARLFDVMLKAFEERPYATALVDPIFTAYFQDLVQKHKIQEYYLVEPMGTFFMIDEAYHTKCLMTFIDDMLDIFLPEEAIPSLGAEAFQRLKNREQIFCFLDPFQPFDMHFENWAPYLKAPHILKGQRSSYYTYFGDNLIQLPENKIQIYQGEEYSMIQVPGI